MSLRNLLIAILVIALSGCAQKVYVNPNVSNEQSQRDFAACQLYAETGIPPATTTPPPNTGNKSYDTNCNVWGTTANCTTKEVVYQPTAEESLGYGLGTGFASGFARGFEVAKRTKLCMESKGYSSQDKKTFEKNQERLFQDAISKYESCNKQFEENHKIEMAILKEIFVFNQNDPMKMEKKLNSNYLNDAQKNAAMEVWGNFSCGTEHVASLKKFNPYYANKLGQYLLKKDDLKLRLLKEEINIGVYNQSVEVAWNKMISSN